jgi:serine/threonine-protein kinase
VPQPDLQLEIAHLLLIDIVGYSTLLVNEQIESVQELGRIARSSESFQNAEKNGKLIRVPTGDGMALLFFRSPEEPVRCALEISQKLKESSTVRLRMGIHSGPVNQVRDVNDTINVAGSGINVAQRVMDCGDAGHILLSKHVADDLAQYRHWQPYLQDLGEYEVKHGLRLGIVNLCKDGAGNPALPEKLRRGKRWKQKSITVRPINPQRVPRWAVLIVVFLCVLGLAISSIIFVRSFIQRSASLNITDSVSEKSIAVLPFENLSDEKQNAYFTDGMQDEILNDLAKIADLKVISRTSVMQYKGVAQRNLREIAHQLGVAHILEGSVQRTANRVRVSAQLIDARTDTHTWAEHYDRPLDDVFAIQSEIARTIADQLQAKISPSEKVAIETAPTVDLAAFELYQRAKALWGDVSDSIHAEQKLPQAIQFLDEAAKRDPHFLAAWCLLARTHGAMYTLYDHTQSRLELANAAVQTAIRLQPETGEAHLALALYYYQGFRDYEMAHKELTIAQRALPNSAEVLQYAGLIDRRQGNWTEGERNLERASELDPRNLFTLQQLAMTYFAERRYVDELRTWNRVLEITPGDAITRISIARVAFHWRADMKSYQKSLADLIAENPSVATDVDDPDYALCERTPAAASRALKNYPRDGRSIFGADIPIAYWEGMFARYQGDAVKARGAFNAARKEVQKRVEKQPDFAPALGLLGLIDADLERKEDAIKEGRRACELLPISKDAVDGTFLAINLAQIYALVGETDLAIEQINAVQRAPNMLSYGLLKLHPYWDSLRGDPRFEKIVASLAPK